jgi:hypothetical protein
MAGFTGAGKAVEAEWRPWGCSPDTEDCGVAGGATEH